MDTVASLEQRAIELARRGEFGADARGVNEELTRLAPANQGAWTRLGRCCLELNLLDEATAALDAALQLNPQNTIARNLQIDVSKRRAGASAAVPVARRVARTSAGARSARTSASLRSGRTAAAVLPGIGRAEFTALAHLPPEAAAESLTARVEPLMMALNDRPFAARAVEARNRAGQAGVRLFRRGSVQAGSPGHVFVSHQGGRWEPQLNVGFFAGGRWSRDALSAGIVFNLAEGGRDDMSDAGRERLFEYFQAFQQLVSSTWRQHLTDWMRANGGFLQFGHHPPATDVLPYDAVERLIRQDPGELGWVSVGRWLFADRGEDIGILTDGPVLVRWLEQTFTDLLPLWGTIYRDKYKS